MSTILDILRSSSSTSTDTKQSFFDVNTRVHKRSRAEFSGLGPSLHDVIETMKYHKIELNWDVRPTMEWYGVPEEYITYVEKYRHHLRKHMEVWTLNIQQTSYDSIFMSREQDDSHARKKRKCMT